MRFLLVYFVNTIFFSLQKKPTRLFFIEYFVFCDARKSSDWTTANTARSSSPRKTNGFVLVRTLVFFILNMFLLWLICVYPYLIIICSWLQSISQCSYLSISSSTVPTAGCVSQVVFIFELIFKINIIKIYEVCPP